MYWIALVAKIVVSAGMAWMISENMSHISPVGEELRNLHLLSTYVLTLALCYGFLWTAMTVRADLLEENATAINDGGAAAVDEALRRRARSTAGPRAARKNLTNFEIRKVFRKSGSGDPPGLV